MIIRQNQVPGQNISRVSLPSNYGYAIIDTAAKYINVPYISGNSENEYEQPVAKWRDEGYNGIDCSGLVCWAYLKNGHDPNPSIDDSRGDVTHVDGTNAHTLASWFLYHNYYDNAQPEDLCFVDANKNGTVDHVAIFLDDPRTTPTNECHVLHARGGDNADQVLIEIPNPKYFDEEEWFWGAGGYYYFE